MSSICNLKGLRASGVLLLVGAFLAMVQGVSAATINAASADRADVASAVSSANDGDTVNIPAGNVSWSSALSITKPITVMGAGTNSTVLNGGKIFTVSLPSGKGDKLVRISNIGFNGNYVNGNSVIYLQGKDHNGSGTAITAFRVDHCYFHAGMRTVQPNGWCYGVIDHCVFVDPSIGVGPIGDDDYAWKRPIEPGSTNAVVIEDCQFYLTAAVNTSPYAGGWPQEMIYHQEGTRSVIRNCLFDGTGYTADGQNFIDAHGNQNIANGSSSDFRGTVLMECYNNVFKGSKSYRFMVLRAGSHIVYNNQMSTTQNLPLGSSVWPIQMWEEEAWQSDFFSPLKTAWPAQDQITNSFFWNNTYNGAATTPYVGPHAAEAIFIQNGRDFWNHAPDASTAYSSYKALAYPHPLVSGIPGGGTTPPPNTPQISVSTSQLDFGSIQAGTTANQTFTVRNTGEGTLTGTATVSAPYSIVGSASYSLGSGASQTISVRFAPSAAGTFNQNLNLTGGDGATVALSGSSWTILSGMSFLGNAGTLTGPFTAAADGAISQAVETLDPSQGGSAVYTFLILVPGLYTVSADVNAPASTSDSIFVNIDAQPVSPDNIWDLNQTAGATTQTATWRSLGGAMATWNLGVGVHQVILRGREAGVSVSRLNVVSATVGRPAAPNAPGNLRLAGS